MERSVVVSQWGLADNCMPDRVILDMHGKDLETKTAPLFGRSVAAGGRLGGTNK